MAANTQLSIRDEQSAKAWLQMVEGINQDYFTAMKDAGDTLVDMQNFADGTLVDDYVKFGTEILNAAQSTFEAIKTISDTVNKILDFAKNFTENVVSGIGRAVTKMFN